tara:strand:- start:198 stop:1079 length:882 start_codon:yes stop_codon:yes gene_type:complete
MIELIWSKGPHRNMYSDFQTETIVKDSKSIINIINMFDGGVIWIRTGSDKNPDNVTDLDIFSKNLQHIKKPSILVTSDGDRPVPGSYSTDTVNLILNCDNIVKWYTQNYDMSNNHHKFKHMPIGMDFHSPWMLVENDPYKKLLFMLNIRLSTKNKNKSQILSDTHTHLTNPIRKTLFETIKNNKYVVFTKRRLTFVEITRAYNNFLFVLSPEGNGLDCHRTWELLLAGCIVIVKSSSLDKMYIDNQLPVVILNDWSELNNNIETKLENWKNKYIQYTDINSIYPKLKYNYWLK